MVPHREFPPNWSSEEPINWTHRAVNTPHVITIRPTQPTQHRVCCDCQLEYEYRQWRWLQLAFDNVANILGAHQTKKPKNKEVGPGAGLRIVTTSRDAIVFFIYLCVPHHGTRQTLAFFFDFHTYALRNSTTAFKQLNSVPLMVHWGRPIHFGEHAKKTKQKAAYINTD